MFRQLPGSAALSLTPRFSGVGLAAWRRNRFSGLPTGPKPLKRLEAEPARCTPLKRGVNERRAAVAQKLTCARTEKKVAGTLDNPGQSARIAPDSQVIPAPKPQQLRPRATGPQSPQPSSKG